MLPNSSRYRASDPKSSAPVSARWKGRAPRQSIPIRRPAHRGNQGDIQGRIGSLGAFLSGFGAVVSLVIAVGFGKITYDAQVERDEYDLREQASRVSIWTESDGTDWKVHILNRSPDPVTNWSIIFNHPSDQMDYVKVDMSAMPPCTDLIFYTSTTPYEPWLDNLWVGQVIGIYFHDRHGEDWYRSLPGELLEELPDGTYDHATPIDATLPSKSATSCEAA